MEQPTEILLHEPTKWSTRRRDCGYACARARSPDGMCVGLEARENNVKVETAECCLGGRISKIHQEISKSIFSAQITWYSLCYPSGQLGTEEDGYRDEATT